MKVLMNRCRKPEAPSKSVATLRTAAGRDARIGWVISNSRATASSRLQGYLIHEWLLSTGERSELIGENFNAIRSVWTIAFFAAALRLCRSRCDVVVFEGGDWPMQQLALLARRWGKRAVGVRCDPIPANFDSTFDLTIVPTKQLQQALKIRRAAVIEDCVEVREDQFKRNHALQPRLRVAWVGHANYKKYITDLVSRLRENSNINDGFDFDLISKGEFATHQWSESTVADDIMACDIALIALPKGPWFETKSSNRLALMMSLGMPTIATMIPSYRSLAADGVNGIFVESDEDIAAALFALRDPALRERFSCNARQTVGRRFRMESIGPQWRATLASALDMAPTPVPRSARWAFLAKIFGLFSIGGNRA